MQLYNMALLDQYVIVPLLAVVFCLAFSFFFASKQQLNSVLLYLPLPGRGRRASTSNTPPRSLSPDKKVSQQSQPDYSNVYPPSTRPSLSMAAKSLSAQSREALKGEAVNPIEFKKNIIPFEADFRTCEPSTFTPMEVSVAELKALGDFPDYSVLTGVPMPAPYVDFKLETALPRPYRPFRWAYHQTMCKLYSHWVITMQVPS